MNWGQKIKPKGNKTKQFRIPSWSSFLSTPQQILNAFQNIPEGVLCCLEDAPSL
jgi:hypothetical protein